MPPRPHVATRPTLVQPARAGAVDIRPSGALFHPPLPQSGTQPRVTMALIGAGESSSSTTTTHRGSRPRLDTGTDPPGLPWIRRRGGGADGRPVASHPREEALLARSNTLAWRRGHDQWRRSPFSWTVRPYRQPRFGSHHHRRGGRARTRSRASNQEDPGVERATSGAARDGVR